jgi:hypothetical protein
VCVFSADSVIFINLREMPESHIKSGFCRLLCK